MTDHGPATLCSQADKTPRVRRGPGDRRATTRYDFSALLKQTGIVTLDPGFVNTASCK